MDYAPSTVYRLELADDLSAFRILVEAQIGISFENERPAVKPSPRSIKAMGHKPAVISRD